MSDLPTVEDVLAVIDGHPESDYPMPDGTKFISWVNLKNKLFANNSPLWRRPKGQPHGLDQSPAFEFMNSLGFHPELRVIRRGGRQYFARRDYQS